MTSGLAPWPFGVGQVELEWLIDGAPATNAWWFFDPSGIPADSSTAESIADQFILGPLGEMTYMVSAAATATACRVTVSSTVFASATVQFDPVPGRWPGAQAMNVCCGLRWLTQFKGRGTAPVTRLVSTPDFFVDSTYRLSANGYANLRDHGAAFLNEFNAITAFGPGTIQLGTLHRILNGAARHPPLFDQAIGVTPSPHLLTMKRRLPRGRQISPT